MAVLTELFSKSEDHFSYIRDDVHEQGLTVTRYVGAHVVLSKIGAGEQPVQL